MPELNQQSILSPDQLATDFDQLSSECVAVCEAQLAADDDLASKFSRAYLMFLRLQQNPAVFASIYEREGFKAPPTDAERPDFTTYVKVLFRLDLEKPNATDEARYAKYGQSLRNKVSDYAAAFERLHAEYSDNPENFRRQSEAKLKAFHIDGGGIRGAKKWRADKNAGVKNTAVGVQTCPEPDTSAISNKWLEDNALDILKKTTITTAMTVTNAGAFTCAADGLSACIVYNRGDGTLEYIGASNDNDVLAAVARKVISNPRYTSGQPFRTLCEVAATQRYPKEFTPTGSRLNVDGNFGTWYRDVYLDKGKTGQPAPRRLVVRSDALLLSASDLDSGVITIVRPAQSLLAQAQSESYLDDLDLRRIEHWLDEGITASFECDPAASLATRPNSSNSYLTIKSLADGIEPHELQFPEISQRSTAQVDLDLSKFVPAWSFTAERRWLVKLQADFLSRWFAAHAGGKKLLRNVHRSFKLKIDTTNFSIGYELDETGTHPSYDAILGTAGTTSVTLNGQFTDVLVRAKDFASIFHNLASLDTIGEVKLSGDRALILVEFKTDIGAYQIAIPTVSDASTLMRDVTHMKQY